MLIAIIVLSLLVVVQLAIIWQLLNRVLAQAKVAPLDLPNFRRDPEPEPPPEPRRKVMTVPFMS